MLYKEINKNESTTLLGEQLFALSANPPENWNKTGNKSRPNIHSLLRYPAMMVPCMQGQILDYLLNYSKKDCYIFDPFVGSGTILTEASLRGLDFVGVDINPLAMLVCEVKKLIDEGYQFKELAPKVITHYEKDNSYKIDVDFPKREKWFTKDSSIILSRIRRSILKIDDINVRKLLWVVFAETLRQTSNSRTSTYKLHVRKPEDYIPAENIFKIFKGNLNDTLKRVDEYVITKNKIELDSNSTIQLILDDIRKAKIPMSNRHQILVTSPPYGDNQTTIPYGQFSYLSLKWIPFSELPLGTSEYFLQNSHKLDSESLGGNLKNIKEKQDIIKNISPSLSAYLVEAEKQNKLNKVRKVAAFMYDFYESLSHLRTTFSTAHWVFTTGNRTVAGIPVPFDKILLEMVLHLGGKHIASVERQLPGKRMPTRNSLGTTINMEVTLIAEFI
ncbi:DNA methyltransferase [Acinetobacter baumannii]|uniref:DNA methyltransferase n=1 Tax=Acinetobacter baumannii TaxID=470 RepID=UPI00233FF9B0|nr:DNA methyltransferase [Acinetobacter baumannii]MDC4913679.1 site-specific DNA-methyltransferase [Acinetobacter baumannii]WNX59152.1 DNA methyltransferase [Acinetobacter baumannii]